MRNLIEEFRSWRRWQRYVKNVRCWRDGTGQVLMHVHDPALCEGRPCVIHHPSNHSMRSFRTHYRFDRGLMERICPHGVGHPDPDDLAWHVSEGREYMGVHGCDGCCRG